VAQVEHAAPGEFFAPGVNADEALGHALDDALDVAVFVQAGEADITQYVVAQVAPREQEIALYRLTHLLP